MHIISYYSIVQKSIIYKYIFSQVTDIHLKLIVYCILRNVFKLYFTVGIGKISGAVTQALFQIYNMFCKTYLFTYLLVIEKIIAMHYPVKCFVCIYICRIYNLCDCNGAFNNCSFLYSFTYTIFIYVEGMLTQFIQICIYQNCFP